MKETIPHCNRTLNLRDCFTAWCLDMQHQCWCLEDVLYTEKATVPKFQRLCISCSPEDNLVAQYLDGRHTILILIRDPAQEANRLLLNFSGSLIGQHPGSPLPHPHGR